MNNYNRNDPATPPRPENYKASVGISGGQYHFGGNEGSLTCTTCDEVIRTDIEAVDLHGNALYALEGSITRHNAKKHKDLLYVFTSAGWMQAGQLIPDPVKQINDVQNKYRAAVQQHPLGQWHPPKDYGQTLCNND